MLKILRRLNGKEWAQAGLSLLFIVAQVWLDLKLPDYMSDITRLTQTEGSAMADIWTAGGYMLLCALGSLAASVIVGFFAARIAASFSRRLRSGLYAKVDAFSMHEISRFSTASLITRSTNDITQIQLFITMGLQMIVKAPIMAVWAITKIAGKGLEWTAATGVTIVILVAVLAILMALAMPKFKKMQQLTDNLNHVTMENLTGLRVVRAYNAEDYQQAKFEKANTELTNTQLFTSRSMAVLMPLMTLLMSGLTLSIYWIGAYLIDAAGMMDKITLFSNMVVFSSYAMQIIMSFMMLVMIFILLPRASVSAVRINEVLDTEPTILEGKRTEGLPGMAGTVEFKNVSFRYPDAADDALHGVSFTAHKGETVAFIGSTGSGKSTLINLVPRFFDTTEGEVLVDGVNIREYTQQALNNKIGFVPQKAVLFRGTVESNVRYGDNGKPTPSLDDVKRAIRIAQSEDFVEQMEGRYEAAVAERGANLSGGQKQRVSIARALIRQAPILILDDCLSAVDTETERKILEGLKSIRHNRTCIIIAHRISAVRDADEILVLENGEIAERGSHDELMANSGIYSRMYERQLLEDAIKEIK